MCVTATEECVCRYMSDVCVLSRVWIQTRSAAGPPLAAPQRRLPSLQFNRTRGAFAERSGADITVSNPACHESRASQDLHASLFAVVQLSDRHAWREDLSHLVQGHEEELDGAAGEEDAWSGLVLPL